MKRAARGNKRIYLIFYLRVFSRGNFLGFIIDISTGGMKIISESAIKSGRKYRLRMKLPPDIKNSDKTDYIEINAKCVWSKPDEENESFFLNGFELGDIDSHTREVIEQTIKEYRLR